MDIILLDYFIKKNGFDCTSLSKAIGMTICTLSRKRQGITEFTLNEIKSIKKVLHLSSEEVLNIFFADELS